jgi:biopolymer transport protein ExbB/TolQ
MVSVVLYVLAQIGFAIAAIYYISITPLLALVISLVILAVFVLFIFSAGIGRQHVKEVARRNIEKTSRMDAIKLAVRGMDESISDPELKKKVIRLVEEIRYSDPVSRQDLDGIESDLEKAIDDVKAAIAKGDSKAIASMIDTTMNMIKERNSMCKEGK